MKKEEDKQDNANSIDLLKDFQQIDEGGDIFKQMFKYSIIPTIIHDMEMTIINANDSAVREFGYSREDFLKKKIFDLHIESELDHSAEVLNQMQVENKLSVETSFKRKDGSVFIAEATPCKFMLGNKPVIHVFIQDITERKMAMKKIHQFNNELEDQVAKRTKELKLKNSELESFSYTVSHDLRAPLRAISNYSKILNEDYRSNLDLDGGEIIDLIMKNTTKMSHLIDEILLVSRLDRETAKKQDINMQQVFENAYSDLTQDKGERKIEFRLGKLSNCQADKTMITQLVTNLLSNAIKYTRPREISKIEVSNYESDGSCVYVVKDNGVGFDMQYYDRLFNIFERLHKTSDFDGTGVGLSIVRKVIEYHNGTVWAESKLNEGSTFYFSIPI
ncbi:MAG: hypothetical protein CMO01_17840 [Thalassobius sp.]|nr:hypothetical protein [Thalassovita sp.]